MDEKHDRGYTFCPENCVKLTEWSRLEARQ